MNVMTAMAPFGEDIDLVNGVMANPDRHLVRNASVMRGYYADEAAAPRFGGNTLRQPGPPRGPIQFALCSPLASVPPLTGVRGMLSLRYRFLLC